MSQTSKSIRTAVLTLTWFPVLYTFTNHVYQPVTISGRSMTPTFNPGTDTTTNDVALVQKYGVSAANALRRGDVVMFRLPEDPEKLVTKRVVGVQGDTIITRSPPYPRPQAVVPRNHVWVEGDNAFHLVDSNNFGPISQGLVVGKVVRVIWPVLRWGTDILRGGRDPRKGASVVTLDERTGEK